MALRKIVGRYGVGNHPWSIGSGLWAGFIHFGNP